MSNFQGNIGSSFSAACGGVFETIVEFRSGGPSAARSPKTSKVETLTPLLEENPYSLCTGSLRLFWPGPLPDLGNKIEVGTTGPILLLSEDDDQVSSNMYMGWNDQLSLSDETAAQTSPQFTRW